ncbi:MAG: DUF4307 domain-containing protein [Cellulomonadaceae bacterium]|nr:DUF4307 domain-containing protein [Cellulomonadaceae bacterium]
MTVEQGLTPPAGRYGPVRAPSRRRRAVVLVALLVVAACVAVWLGWQQASVPVRWQDVGYTLDGASAVQIDFDVIRSDPSTAVRCRLRALNQQYAEVGVRMVDVPGGDETTLRLTADVATSEAAVTGLVDSCWVLDD